jgi:membrane protease YdiL (CAAX protease family)
VPLALYLALLGLALSPLPSSTPAGALLRLACGALAFGGGGLLLMRRHGTPLSRLSLSPAAPGLPASRLALRVLIVVLAALALGAGRGLSARFLPSSPNRGMMEFVLAIAGLAPLAPLLWLLHSLGEELYFRGFLYNRLRALFGPSVALALNAVMFSALHVPFSPDFAVFLALFSAAATALYERYGSFFYPVALHMLANLWGHALLHELTVNGRPWLRHPLALPLFLAAVCGCAWAARAETAPERPA